MKNLFIKFICLILAIGLWYAMKIEETVTKKIMVQIKPILNEQMIMGRLSPFFVEVTLKGSRRILLNYSEKEKKIELDFSNETQSKTLKKFLQLSDFKVEQDIKVINIKPDRVELEVDRLGKKVLEVEPQLVGDVGANYVLDKVTINPKRIEVTGPIKRLNPLKNIFTEKIIIQGMTNDFMQKTKIQKPFKSLQFDERVKVFVYIAPSKEVRSFDELEIKLIQKSTQNFIYSIKPSKVGLSLKASSLDWQGVSKSSFTPYVDIGDLSKGVYELPIFVIKKDSFIIEKIEPRSVEVTLTEAS